MPPSTVNKRVWDRKQTASTVRNRAREGPWGRKDAKRVCDFDWCDRRMRRRGELCGTGGGLASVAGSEARQHLARAGNSRTVPARRTEGALVAEDRRGLCGAGGDGREGIHHRSHSGGGREEPPERFRAQPRARHRTRPLSGGTLGQGAVEARI